MQHISATSCRITCSYHTIAAFIPRTQDQAPCGLYFLEGSHCLVLQDPKLEPIIFLPHLDPGSSEQLGQSPALCLDKNYEVLEHSGP